MAELADAADSKSADLRVMGVRPPLPAPRFDFRRSASRIVVVPRSRQRALMSVYIQPFQKAILREGAKPHFIETLENLHDPGSAFDLIGVECFDLDQPMIFLLTNSAAVEYISTTLRHTDIPYPEE